MKTTSIITVPFHVGDFLSGTMHMDTLEKGAYIMLIMAHYQAGEEGLPNCDKRLRNICGVSAKVWKRIKPTLIEKFTVSDTKWVSKKCVLVLQKVHEKSAKQRDKALKKHDTGHATAEPRQSQPKPKPKPNNISTSINTSTRERIVEIWNKEMNGVLPLVKGINAKRKAALNTMLKEMKDNQEWKFEQYCKRIKQSDFLTGRSKPWKANFDWAINTTNLYKVIEGNYDNG